MNSRNWYRSPPQNEPQVSQPRPTYKSWVHHEPAMKAETTVAIQPFSLFNLVARWEWAINPTRWPLYHREWLDIICKMCCVGPRGGLDRCWKSHPPPGFDHRTAASRYTDWAILATYSVQINTAVLISYRPRALLVALCIDFSQIAVMYTLWMLLSNPILHTVHQPLFAVTRRTDRNTGGPCRVAPTNTAVSL